MKNSKMIDLTALEEDITVTPREVSMDQSEEEKIKLWKHFAWKEHKLILNINFILKGFWGFGVLGFSSEDSSGLIYI